MSKKFDQIFLKDINLINIFIKKINPKNNDYLLEIGAGLGSLTIPILKYVKFLIIIEIDYFLCLKLKNKITKDYNNFFIINNDARFLNYKNILNIFNINNKKLRVFGSLPYSCSVPIIINCIKNINYIEDIYFFIQKELSDKIINNNLNKNLSRFSIILKFFFNIELIYKCILPLSFFPKPKVNSSIIKLIPKNDRLINLNEINILDKITKIIFNKKRKTIKNNLLNIINKKDLDYLIKTKMLNLNLRPENLSIKQYYKLFIFLKHKI